MFLVLLIVGVLAPVAAVAAESESSIESRTSCVADILPKLRLLPDGVRNCTASDSSCQEACEAGDGLSCLGRAYALEVEPLSRGEAVSLYRRSCLLGLANACTNYAATVWARDHSVEELECARRTFAKACVAEEPFACGMLGRIAFDRATSPAEFERAGRELQAACERLKGFPCRVLAKHLEAGDLGAYPPTRIGELLERACEGGDPDACGRPSTASETFQ